MWTKLYLAVVAVSALLVAFFMFYAWSWLHSIGLPTDAAAGFAYNTSSAATTLWIATFGLLILGNAVLWTTGRSWAMWTTFVFFSAFSIAKTFWLNQVYISYDQRHFGGEYDILTSGFQLVTVILVVLAAVIVFLDMYLVIRLRAKTYPKPLVIEEPEPEIEDPKP
jgi:hypothetical protein